MVGEQVTTQLLKIIWIYILDTWKVWNSHLHNNVEQINLPNYRQVVQHLYEQRNQLPPEMKEALYCQPLEEILKQPAARLQQWAQRGLHYFNQQLRAAKTQATLCTMDICTFFQRQPQPPNDLHLP